MPLGKLQKPNLEVERLWGLRSLISKRDLLSN